MRGLYVSSRSCEEGQCTGSHDLMEWDLLCSEPSTSDVFQLPLIVYQAPRTASTSTFRAIMIGRRGRLTWIPTLNVPKFTQTRPGPRTSILVLVVALEDGFTLRIRDLRVHHLDIVRRCARGGIL
jgi:hypothetical protein